jgi:putative ABC transport system ATP-binding protein
MSLIALDRISRSYVLGEVTVHALREVSLKVEPGEALAIMGPSGSGKSTLLAILGCLDIPTTGRYRLLGHDVSSMSPAHLARIRCQNIGFVFQGFNLLPRLTALENVELPQMYLGATGPRGRRRKAAEMLARVGLGERLGHLPSQLSGGQQQRVAIARALVNSPGLILADEPTGALDSVTGGEIMDLLLEINQQGTAVVVVTHEADIAARLKRQLLLRDGRIERDELYSVPDINPPGKSQGITEPPQRQTVS